MKFIPMLRLLERAASGGYAVPAFCVWSAETMEAVLRTASSLRAPVILMSGPWEFKLLSPRDMGAVAHALVKRFDVPAALHLDHGNSLEQVDECLAAGYTSVMLDYSTRPLSENSDAMKLVVAKAHPLGVTVEGELGLIGQVDDITMEGSKESSLTDPDVAATFVKETGIDTLAVAIGNAHGVYKQLPHLDFDRLKAIQSRVPVPLVLHGGSGTPDGDLRQAISLGIAKVNVASELISAVRTSLMEQWNSGKNLWTPMAQAAAIEAMTKVAEKWLRLTGAAGRA